MHQCILACMELWRRDANIAGALLVMCAALVVGPSTLQAQTSTSPATRPAYGLAWVTRSELAFYARRPYRHVGRWAGDPCLAMKQQLWRYAANRVGRDVPVGGFLEIWRAHEFFSCLRIERPASSDTQDIGFRVLIVRGNLLCIGGLRVAQNATRSQEQRRRDRNV